MFTVLNFSLEGCFTHVSYFKWAHLSTSHVWVPSFISTQTRWYHFPQSNWRNLVHSTELLRPKIICCSYILYRHGGTEKVSFSIMWFSLALCCISKWHIDTTHRINLVESYLQVYGRSKCLCCSWPASTYISCPGQTQDATYSSWIRGPYCSRTKDKRRLLPQGLRILLFFINSSIFFMIQVWHSISWDLSHQLFPLTTPSIVSHWCFNFHLCMLMSKFLICRLTAMMNLIWLKTCQELDSLFHVLWNLRLPVVLLMLTAWWFSHNSFLFWSFTSKQHPHFHVFLPGHCLPSWGL